MPRLIPSRMPRLLPAHGFRDRWRADAPAHPADSTPRESPGPQAAQADAIDAGESGTRGGEAESAAGEARTASVHGDGCDLAARAAEARAHGAGAKSASQEVDSAGAPGREAKPVTGEAARIGTHGDQVVPAPRGATPGSPGDPADRDPGGATPGTHGGEADPDPRGATPGAHRDQVAPAPKGADPGTPGDEAGTAAEEESPPRLPCGESAAKERTRRAVARAFASRSAPPEHAPMPPEPVALGEPAAGARFGVPLFAHPLVAPAEWAELARPGAPLDWVAFDVSGGPGAKADGLYAEALGRVRENGVPILGRLDAAYGARQHGDLVTEATHYLDWYRVDGFYVDRAPTLRSEAASCRRAVGMLRAVLGDKGAVVLAPGAHPHPAYAEFADQLVTFAGPWARYRWSEVPQWTACYPAALFAHLVHGLPAAHLDEALRIARWQGAGTVCLTDRTDRDGADPWAGLSGYWHRAARGTARPERARARPRA